MGAAARRIAALRPALHARLHARLEARRQRWAARAILRTPPVAAATSGAVVFSQVCGRDCLSYLVAAKSLARHTGLGDFVVLDDGTLTPAQHALLHRHLGSLQIVPIADMRGHDTPAGGTWERLLLGAHLGEAAYVVQMDSDTLTLGPLDAVRDSIAQARAFTLTSEPDARVLDVAVAAARACEVENYDHYLQHAAESRLGCLPPALAASYIRGCSGFTGLPPAPRLAVVREISRRMEAAMGPRWSQWGTEQVTTNLLTANAPQPQVLAPPVYSTYEGRDLPASARFVHFIGTHRTSGSTYRRLTRAVIAGLQKPRPTADRPHCMSGGAAAR